MNFRLRNDNFGQRSGKKKFILASFFVVFFIVIFSFYAPRNILFGVASPFWNIRNSITVFFSESIELMRSKSSLIAENNLLKKSLENDRENQLLFEAIKNENDNLKNILGRKNNSQKEILAAILTKPFLSPYDTLIIDAGSEDDISAGDQVLANGNIYIGYVAELYDYSSKVVLYSSSGEKMNVLIGSDKIEKEANGMGGGNFVAKTPAGSDIKIGDPIVVPSISYNVFSAVEKIESKPADSFETILFKNPVNISELQYVEVLPGDKTK